jgi:hypothetical protein
VAEARKVRRLRETCGDNAQGTKTMLWRQRAIQAWSRQPSTEQNIRDIPCSFQNSSRGGNEELDEKNTALNTLVIKQAKKKIS